MTVLSDSDLMAENFEHDLVTPFLLQQLQPASYDLRLSQIALMDGDDLPLPYILEPFGFILGSTFEVINVPIHMAAKFEGKSSLGRSGIMTHVSAGFIDPGFQGALTLEIFNASDRPFELRQNMRIGQIMFQYLHNPCSRPYSEIGHYQNQYGPTVANPESFYGSY